MSAEKIARMHKGLIVIGPNQVHPLVLELERQQRRDWMSREMRDMTAVVDMTAIYRDWITNPIPMSPYVDTMMCPPLNEAMFCYRTDSNYTLALGTSAYQEGSAGWDLFKWERQPANDEGDDGHVIDWSKVKWIIATALYIDVDGASQVYGPAMSWKLAVNEDGTVQDVLYVGNRGEADVHRWDGAFCVYMRAVTFLNCRNIELVTPQRPRAAARRMARFGLDVKEIHVRPIGKTYQGQTTKVGSGLMPLSTVRGHLAKYGIDGRKKLFGKLTGVYWIPAHVRGLAENGVNNPTRVLETE